MTEVSIVRCEEYSDHACRVAIEEALAPFGGLEWVKPGMKIAIKANLVGAIKPEKAATTHPKLLCVLVCALKERGASVVIGDSPGSLYNAVTLNHVYNVTGMQEVAACGAELNHNFEKKIAQYPEAHVAKSFSYTAYLDDADAIISFCKLKSHGMMSLSAAAKNQFGVIPGTMKPEYHFRYPEPLDFAGMIVDLNEYFKPRLFLVDAVVGMEGNGPTAGTPRKIGAVLAAENCHKLDLICAKLIGVEPMSVPTLRAAANFGLCPERAEEVSVSGDIAPFVVPDFKRVEQNKSLQFESVFPRRVGKAFGAIARKALRASPKLKKKECVGCGVCKNICPAKAIEIQKKKAIIDKKKCIRCFCCQEFCPKGAMKVHRPWIARILNK